MQWQDSQIKSFTRWINGHISKRGLKVENLETDLNDGVILINLLEVLTGKAIEKYYKSPKNKTYMIANHTIALAFMGQHKINANCSAQDLADGRITMLLGLIWSLIRQFSFKSAGKLLFSKTELFPWCKSLVEGYKHIRFDGSLPSFQDGLILCALIHKYDSSLLDYDSLNPNAGVENIRIAFSITELKLNMPRLIDQSDINETFFLDEQSLLAYLTEFHNIFHRRSQSFSKPTLEQDSFAISPETSPVLQKDSEANLDIVLIAEKYLTAKQQEITSTSQIEQMRAEIEQLHIQIVHLTEEYETRLLEEREVADKEIKEREEKIESLERKIEEFAKHQGSQLVDFDQQAQWNFINEQKKTINHERLKLEQEKRKLAEEQDLLQRAQWAIQKQKDEIFVEKERFGKDKRAVLLADLKVIDFQGKEVASQIEAMREELKLAKVVVSKLKDDEFDLSYLGNELIDESEAMDYYNDAWWEQQRMDLVEEEDLRTRRIIMVQTQVRIFLARRERSKLAQIATATMIIKRIIRRWRARRIQGILMRYEPHVASVILVQSIVRRWSARRACKMLAKRTKVAQEILESEKTYVARLEIVVKVFIEPLRIQGMLTKEQMRAIFSELEVILAYNKMLLAKLETRMKTWNFHTKLGDIFMEMTDFLKAYTQYVNNYNSALTTINAIKHIEKLATFMSKCHKDPRCLGQDIGAFLILPIQRIPRYVMLLQDMFQNTVVKHFDYEDLRVSLWKMKRVADYINDKKRDADNIHEVLTVQDKLTGKFDNDLVLAQPHRRYLREGFLTDMKEKKKIYYFLFNDLLIGTKKRSQKPFTASHSFKYLHRIPLAVASIMLIPNAKTPSFRISTGEFSMHTFCASTPAETTQWFQEIQSAIEKLSTALRARAYTVAENPLGGSSSPREGNASGPHAFHRHSLHLGSPST